MGLQPHTIAFIACQLAASGYAFARGGLPERIVAAELIGAAALNWALPFDPGRSFHSVEWNALALDAALLAALVPVALFANRYWPIWVAAVQLDTIAVHGVRAFDPLLRAPVYALLAGLAAYPILLLLAVGTLRHREREARAGIGEPPWITPA